VIVDVILDVNIPKKVKKMNGKRVLHIGDIDTQMHDEEILRLASKLGCVVVTHDRDLAVKISRKSKVLYIKNSIPAEDILKCIEKNENLLRTASIFCENGIQCKNC
jgi:uncharacterized protein with PIN domain